VSFGDVVAGGLILGGIVAIASAANSSKHEEAYDYPPPPPPPSRYDDRYDYAPPAPRYRNGDDYAPPREPGYRSSGISGAVDSCVGEVERGNDRVASVDNAIRTADGWHVSGQLSQGNGFDCSIGNDGRIRNVTLGSGQSAYDAARAPDGQWSDDAYANARDQVDAGNPYDHANSSE
jgi:hypothetical protein